MAAGDEERRRLERDLHDGAQQRLVAIALSLRLSEAALPDDTDAEVRQTLSRTVTDLREAIDELRALARGIHPAVLDSDCEPPSSRSSVDHLCPFGSISTWTASRRRP